MAADPHIDLAPEALRLVQDILRRLAPHHEVWVFGSRATGKAKPYSDLDLALVGEEPLSISTLAELNEAFRESPLPFKVDVVDWRATSPSFRAVIDQTKRPLTRDPAYGK